MARGSRESDIQNLLINLSFTTTEMMDKLGWI